MKKLTVVFLCAACTLASAAAQPPVRIGSLEFYVKKAPRDSVERVAVDEDCPPCPPCPSENEVRPKPKGSSYKKSYSSDGFAGFGFVQPDNSGSYYTALGGNSFCIDVGTIQRYQLARRFALLGTFQYSYYNYRLWDTASDSLFRKEILNGRVVESSDIKKQVFRSHSFAIGSYTRFYLVAPNHRHSKDGIFVDLGVQGDYVFSKYYNLYYADSEKKKSKNRNGYAFSPFTASAVARVGWGSVAVFARYRFTNSFNPNALPTDLPPITIGVHFL